jgi:hypothetical protein
MKLRHLRQINGIAESDLSISDKKLTQDQEKLTNKINVQKQELILTLVAILPFSLIFDRTRWPA